MCIRDRSTAGDDLVETIDVEARPEADLITAKTLRSGDATPDVGDTVTFLITVANTGPSTATNVSLTDFLPIGLTPTVNNGAASQGLYNPATGVWIIGTLNDGDSVTLTLEGTVDEGQGSTTITNVATAATGDQDDPSTDGDDLTESVAVNGLDATLGVACLLYTSPSPRDATLSRMPSSA